MKKKKTEMLNISPQQSTAYRIILLTWKTAAGKCIIITVSTLNYDLFVCLNQSTKETQRMEVYIYIYGLNDSFEFRLKRIFGYVHRKCSTERRHSGRFGGYGITALLWPMGLAICKHEVFQSHVRMHRNPNSVQSYFSLFRRIFV